MFSPYRPLPLPLQCPKDFNFPDLLQKSSLLDDDDALSIPDGGASGLDESLVSTVVDTAQNSLPMYLPVNNDIASGQGLHMNNEQHRFEPELNEEQGHRPSGSQSRNNSRRAKRRAAAVANHGHIPHSKTLQKHVFSARPMPTNFETDRPSTPKLPRGDRKEWTLEELREVGIRVVPWDGHESTPLLDAEGRVVAVLVGQPRSSQYQQAVTEAYNLLQGGGTGTAHRRGDFSVINCGILHQQGTQQPVRMREAQPELTAQLLGASCFKALAGFASSSYQMWSRGVYNHSKTRLDQIYEKYGLKRNFVNSVFPAAAFNFGPHVWTFRHRDSLNVPYGMCAVQALGHFDAKKGGHMVLWEFGVAIEFPAGACILLPSATITHSNVPTQPGDTRASFTQYIPGGLLRYVDNGMRTEKQFQAQDPTGYEDMCAKKATRWGKGLALLSRWKDIAKDWNVES
ncbi:hypothetical protein H0H93_007015 [Arthromyces matolae]|nr:hypothetical protein H0H93_007015 [Arthromyces matolae]